MFKCGHISKKTNEVCGKPCMENIKKLRCQKHGGSDIINPSQFVVNIESSDVNPYKPASKEWLEWNKKMKKKEKEKSKKEEVKVVENNPFLEPTKNTLECIKNIKYELLFNDFCALCIHNKSYLLKGTPVYIDSKPYTVCKSIKIELYEVKTIKGWGTTEIEVVKDEYDIDSKGQKFPINSIVVRELHICKTTPIISLENMTFAKYMKEIGQMHELCIIDDNSNRVDEKDRLLENAGHHSSTKYSKGFNRVDIDSKDKYSIIINLNHLSLEELNKLIEKKLSMREKYGDDYIYKEFLYKKYGIKTIGGPEVREGPDDSGGKAFEDYNM
jgi:hypothetical protein